MTGEPCSSSSANSRQHERRCTDALSKAHITAYVQQKAARRLAISSAAAAARMTQLVASAKSEHVQFRASEFVLEASGIAPANQPQVSINIEAKAGWVIDLSKPGQPAKIVAGEAKVIDEKPVGD
jgi:hypothetical protein